MTLGMFIPPTYLDASSEAEDFISSSDSNDSLPPDAEDEFDFEEDLADDESIDDVIERITEEAKEQTLRKLGPKIAKQVEPDVLSAIMPNIEDVINELIEQAGEEKIPYFTVSEQPSSGYGERIFNIFDNETNEDVAKFHVRRDNRPRDGYWFNFHYHLSQDGFEKHHQLGEIYWDKNMPPKWMS